MDEDDNWPACPQCGWDLLWEDCADCEDGEVEVYELDPMWYEPGDTEPCAQCQGNSGWWACPNPNCPVVVPAGER